MMGINLDVKPFRETLHADMCGPASLKILLSYYGVDKSEQELAQLANVVPDIGIDDKSIARVAESLGFKVQIKNESNFSDNDIISILNRHLLISDYVAVSIPSNYFSYDQRMYGDERFMGADQWRSILSKVHGSIVEEFTFNPDKTIRDRPQFIGFVLSSL